MAANGNRRWLWVVGPGLMVMLADTDAGSIVTAGQSGATWGFRLLFLQVLLVPVLYLVMELTVRIGIATGKGHAQLIREQFGRRWAIVSVGTLVVAAVGALVTEFAGIAGVAALFGIPAWAAVLPAAAFLVWLVLAGTYRRVEVVGIALGLAELAFVAAAVLAHPALPELARGLSPLQPLGETGYLALVAANIGAVVMPWMVFYQQGAVIDKGLGPRDLRAARVNTAIGALATQIVMASVLVAAAVGLHGRAGSLRSVGDLATALAPSLGATTARLVLTAGILGASLVAAIVVSVALAWAVSEACARPHSLDDTPRRAPLFYVIYTAAVAGRGPRPRQRLARPARGPRRDPQCAALAARARLPRAARVSGAAAPVRSGAARAARPRRHRGRGRGDRPALGRPVLRPLVQQAALAQPPLELQQPSFQLSDTLLDRRRLVLRHRRPSPGASASRCVQRSSRWPGWRGRRWTSSLPSRRASVAATSSSEAKRCSRSVRAFSSATVWGPRSNSTARSETSAGRRSSASPKSCRYLAVREPGPVASRAQPRAAEALRRRPHLVTRRAPAPARGSSPGCTRAAARSATADTARASSAASRSGSRGRAARPGSGGGSPSAQA